MPGPRRLVALAAALAAVAGVVVATQTPSAEAAAPSLKPGFVLRDIVTGLRPPAGADPGDMLTDFVYLPDESLLAAGKYGKVTYVPRTGTPRQIATMATNGTGDLGLLGIAIAPDYQTSKTLYSARAVSSTGAGSGSFGVLRLSKWTVTTGADGTPTGLTGEQTILQTTGDSNVHSISGLVAAQDGTLWVTIGDNSDWRGADPLALRALNNDDPHGKLLHLRPDGSGVPGNPYYNAASPRAVRGMVYANGFRSPFRVSLEPGTGRPVVGDVGNGRIEEINLISPGNTYGWPCWEGNEQSAGWRDMPGCAGKTTTSPMYSYPHVGGSSVTGGLIYTGTTYPQEYRGRYFFGDYTDKTIWSMAYNSAGQVTTPPEGGGFGAGIGAPVKFGSVPTGGDIVYADIGSAKIRRITYAPGNAAPVPVIKSTVDPATRTVAFDATDTTDPNGDEPAYTWDFGDGTTGTGPRPSHTYPAGESFTVRLTAKDPAGAAGTADATIYPGNHAPTLSMQAPDPNHTFAVGEVIAADATAADAEDGPVQVSWSSVVNHCLDVTDCHLHPGDQQQGPQFRLSFAGHPGDSRLEVTAIATDSKGATTTETFVVHPKQRRVTIQTNAPAGFTIGAEQTDSGLFTVGTPLTIIAPEAALNGVATFDKWGDGSTDRVRQLTLPDADQTIQVTYLTPIDRRYNADAAVRGRLGAPTDVEQGDAKVRWRTYAGGRIYWSQATGAHAMFGGILTRYLQLGGHLRYGLPTTDETAGANGGAFNLLAGGQGFYWHPNAGTHPVAGAIFQRYWALGADKSRLGYPRTDEAGAVSGRYSHFQSGSIFYVPGVGAHELTGAILAKWNALGGAARLGFPTTDETRLLDGRGVYNHFQRGSIFWSSGTGAWSVEGGIRTRWAQLGWERSYLGYPTSDEYAVAGGRRSNFQWGYIVYNAATHQVTDRRY
ncbi:PQQ-dependent sugar dehydrogenase [Actinophytocola sp.]|uniref:PQQ-dependent sugar dehydrogenase n=1 Tax=Actinophytocola sp. TaxID=1872138 RepID=UPI002EDA60A8